MKRLATNTSILIVSSALLLSACAQEKPKPQPKPAPVVQKAKLEPTPAKKAPEASFEVVSINEHGDKEDLVEVLETQLSAFNACYTSQLEKDPGIAGQVRFELDISVKGTVDTVTVRGGTLDEDELETCTEGVFKQVRVPEPKTGENVNAHVVMSYTAG